MLSSVSKGNRKLQVWVITNMTLTLKYRDQIKIPRKHILSGPVTLWCYYRPTGCSYTFLDTKCSQPVWTRGGESANQVPKYSERGEKRGQKEGDSWELTKHKGEGMYNGAKTAQEPKQFPKRKDAPQQRNRQIIDIRNYRDLQLLGLWNLER